jgi:DNA-binding response OmpR family regulator
VDACSADYGSWGSKTSQIVASDLAAVIEDDGAEVIGPCHSTANARRLAKDPRIDAAILDVSLQDGDITPVLEALLARDVPVLMYTGGELPEKVRSRHPELVVLHKPMQPGRLLLELKRIRRHRPPMTPLGTTHSVETRLAGSVLLKSETKDENGQRIPAATASEPR